MNALAKLSKIQHALAEAKTLTEVVDIRDQSVAIVEYAKAAGLGRDAVNDAVEFKLRTERKAGAMLAKMDKKVNRHSSANTLLELGIEAMQSHRWQRLSSLPEKIFEQHITDVRSSSDKELTTSSVLRLAAPKKQSTKERNLFECLSLLRRMVARLYLKWPADDRPAMAEQLRNLADQIDEGTLFTEDQE